MHLPVAASIILTVVFVAPSVSGFVISGTTEVANTVLSPNNGICNPANQGKVLTRQPEEDNPIQLTTTKAGGELLVHYSESLGLSPLERMAMACYGNLGVVFSSYYLQPVDVEVDVFENVSTDEDGPAGAAPPLAQWDRVVNMKISDSLFCTATCKVRVYNENMHQTLISQDFSIGKLLRLEGLQPNFRLHEAGRSNNNGGLWRYYSMDCPGLVEFDILEEFSEDAFSLGGMMP